MARWWALVLLLAVSACTTTAPEQPIGSAGALPIVWPEAPEPARIEFVKLFRNAKDLGLRESFSRKLRRLLAGGENLSMLRPYAISATHDQVAVADPGSAVVHLFNTKRKTYRRLNSAGSERFRSPIGVVLAGDRLFVADSELNKVFALDRRLKLLYTLEGFQRPTSLAFDPELQHLFVADTLAHEVQVFDQAGKRLFIIGGRGEKDGQFNYPSHLDFAAGRLFVNDTMNFRVQIFNPQGEHLVTFGKQGTGSGYFAQAKGVAVDSDGHVYIADALSNQVQIFDQNGTFLLGFGNDGDGPGTFRMPTGLAISNDTIYVADSYNRRVQVFRYLPKEN